MDRKIFEAMDASTKTHCENTKHLSVKLAKLASLTEPEIGRIELAAKFHDIGKIRIPDEILYKAGKLTESEYDIMKHHAIYGYVILYDLFCPAIRDMILYHHENVDGTGYYQLSAEKIPFGAKIIHICDVYDALVSDRPYRNAWEKEKAVSYMASQAGTMFDPDLLSIFLEFLV